MQVKTTIGFGSPNKEPDSEAEGLLRVWGICVQACLRQIAMMPTGRPLVPMRLRPPPRMSFASACQATRKQLGWNYGEFEARDANPLIVGSSLVSSQA